MLLAASAVEVGKAHLGSYVAWLFGCLAMGCRPSMLQSLNIAKQTQRQYMCTYSYKEQQPYEMMDNVYFVLFVCDSLADPTVTK